MLSHCADSQGSEPILPLCEGRRFLVETGPVAEAKGLNARTAAPQRKPPQRVEHFWLWDRCASSWTFAPGANAGIALFPLRQIRVSRKGETAESHRQASRARPASTHMSGGAAEVEHFGGRGRKTTKNLLRPGVFQPKPSGRQPGGFVSHCVVTNYFVRSVVAHN